MTERAWLLSDVVQQQGLRPIVITYSALISAQCFGMTVSTSSTVIRAREKAKQAHKAIELPAEMLHNGLAPNSIAYSAAISVCEKDSSLTRR